MALTLAGSASPPQQSQPTQLRLYTVSDPAAGLDWTVTVPAGETWLPLAIRYTLTTGAVVADRSASVNYGALGFNPAAIPAPAVVTAGSLVVWAWYPGAPPIIVGGRGSSSAPSYLIPAGSTISASTLNLQTADQWSNGRVYVLAYL